MIKPYSAETGKKEQVARMFNNIAPKYDFLNHFLSMGIDKTWRKKAIREISNPHPSKILDIATGTGDLAFTAVKLKPDEIVAIDISEEMLAIARQKLERKNPGIRIKFESGDSENIHYPDNTFDAAMVAFGVRNFEDLNKGLKEINRVLVKGGKFAVLEFSKPRNFLFKTIYNFYFFSILPLLGRLFSKDRRAYTYLPESVNEFPDGLAFVEYMKEAGFDNIRFKALTFGIATLYSGTKA